MIKLLLKLTFSLIIKIVYLGYQEAGLNALFLLLPSKLLIPVLVKYGAAICDDVEMQSPVIFHNVDPKKTTHYKNLNIGSQAYIGKEVFFDLADKIILEEKVTISMRVTLLTHTHAGNSPLSSNKLVPDYAPIVLRKGCYIGAGAIILPGVTVGENSIIGAGSVVTRSIPPNSTAVGVPARLITS